MNTELPELNPASRVARRLAAMIPALTGLITLAVENMNSYLWKGKEAMAKAVRALNNRESV